VSVFFIINLKSVITTNFECFQKHRCLQKSTKQFFGSLTLWLWFK